MRHLILAALLSVSPLLALSSAAQDDPPELQVEGPMTLERLAAILTALDPETQQSGPAFQLQIADVPLIVVTDPVADRMRAMVPIRAADGLPAEELMRLMQANFDSALDARYAVAQGRLWGVFIHPLSPLEREQLISGLVQTINVARTYGQTYSGGAEIFGGGDSGGIYQELFEELLEKGQEL